MFAGIILAMMMMIQVPDKADIFVVDDMAAIREMPPSKPTEDNDTISDEEFNYLCRCVEAEAGDQPYLGKCYVVDCILNRVDSNGFPNDVISVINETHKRKDGTICYQFETVLNGQIWKVEVTEETRQAVREELENRKNYEMLYFCMYRWFDSWAEYMFTYPKNRPNNCHHFYKAKEKK